MSLLEELTGKTNIDEITDEELEQLTIYGRLAREAEAEGARSKGGKGGKGGKAGTTAKKVIGLAGAADLDFDLDDEE